MRVSVKVLVKGARLTNKPCRHFTIHYNPSSFTASAGCWFAWDRMAAPDCWIMRELTSIAVSEATSVS